MSENGGTTAAAAKTDSSLETKGLSKTVYVIFLSLLLDLLAFTVILPLLPSLVERYKEEDPGGLYHRLQECIRSFQSFFGVPERFNAVLFGGLLGSLFSMLQFLASPVIGSLSDVYGRRPLLLLTTVGLLLSYGLWALSSSFALFVLSRVIGGLSKGNISLATAIVSDVSSERNRGKAMALIGIAFSLGFIVGPLIGALAFRRHNSFLYPALFSIVLTMLNFGFLAAYFEESLSKNNRRNSVVSSVQKAFALISPKELFSFSSVYTPKDEERQRLRTIGRVYFWYMIIFSGLEFSLTFLVHLRFNFSSMEQGKMFCFIGIIMALLQGGYVRRIQPGNEMRGARTAMFVLIPSLVLTGFSPSTTVLYIALLPFAYSSAVIVPCLTTAVSRVGTVDQKGIIMGTFRSLGALARGLGPIVACSLYWLAGPEICYCLGAIALVYPIKLLKTQ